VSNLDGSEWNDAIEQCNPATTLVVVASKSFNTPESLLNAKTAIEWLKAAGLDHQKHLVAITAQKERAIAYGIFPDHILSIWPWVGGRYSLWSTMGLSIALSIGTSGFEQLLQGAAATDEHFLTQPFEKNIPVILGLLTVWYRSYHNVHSEVLLPYTQRLVKFPSYLQQLDMESCGKSYTTEGTFAKATGLAVWGQTGTPAQHAFNQWLHQGTDTVLTDFILIAQSAEKESPHHQHLLANALAQSQALMEGRAVPNAPQHIPGNRPSTLIVLPTLSPYYLGALLALYEHKVFVQSICWQINPFDQFGVELGKKLTQDILPHLEAKMPSAQSLDSATVAIIGILKQG
jgi:glucose-6-phosphate isomerase